MKQHLLPLSILLLGLTPSCAYMQSHKNIEMMGINIEGAELTPPQYVYETNEGYYLKLDKYLLNKKYPLFHDSIFLGVEDPQFIKQRASHGSDYYQISAGTAQILSQSNGYASLPILMSEIKDNQSTVKTSINTLRRHPVLAQIENSDHLPIIHEEVPKQTKMGIKALSWLDLLVVDSIGSIAYNVAIPFMAPYYFFSDFTENIDKDPFDKN